MDLNKFTEKSKNIIFVAHAIASSNHHQLIEPIHLFRSLLEDEFVKPIFLSQVSTLTKILELIDKEIDKLPTLKELDPKQQSFSKPSLIIIQNDF